MIFKFFQLTFYLLTGRISASQYIDKIAFKIRETFVKSPLARRFIKASFPLDKIKIRPERPGDWKKMIGPHMVEPGPICEMAKARRKETAERKIATTAGVDKYHYVAEYKDKVIGSIYMSPIKDWRKTYGFDGYMISGSHVSPWYRGLGIGEALYKGVIERARAEGIPAIYQTINRSNVRNINLAYKLGFKRADEETEGRLINKTRMHAFIIDLRKGAEENTDNAKNTL